MDILIKRDIVPKTFTLEVFEEWERQETGEKYSLEYFIHRKDVGIENYWSCNSKSSVQGDTANFSYKEAKIEFSNVNQDARYFWNGTQDLGTIKQEYRDWYNQNV